MPFAVPAGAVLAEVIGAGTVFHVALVHENGVRLVCKRLTRRAVREPAGKAAIVREATVLALAKHPALPTLVRVGNDDHGPFLLETHADGVSMRELVDGWRIRKKRVPALLVAHIAHTAVEAIAEIHELHDTTGHLAFVHGDIGPDHVLLGPLGQVRLVDFGAARWRGMDRNLELQDRGTLPFVAPEVARGEVAPNARADVYALAATLLYVATGRSPCAAKDQAAMLAEVGDRGVRLELLDHAEAFSPQQRAALAAALSHDPTGRLSDARALLGALSG